jgi:hypothetical protein
LFREGRLSFHLRAAIRFVGGFVLTMTFQGIIPWEAIGVAVAAGTATGTITRVLLDLLGPAQPNKPMPPAPTDTAVITPSTQPPPEIPAHPRPTEALPAPTEEAN